MEKLKDKKGLLIAVALVVAIVIVIMIIPKGGKKSKGVDSLFDLKQPIIISDGKKRGYITYDGKKILDPIYNHAEPFDGEFAKVSISESGSTKYQVIDRKGEVKYSTENLSSIEHDKEYKIWVLGAKLYDEKLKPIVGDNISVSYREYGFLEFSDSDKKTTGIMNYKGEKIFSWDENSFNMRISKHTLDSDEYYANVSKYQTKDMIINLKNGKTVYELDDPVNKSIIEENNNVFKIVAEDTYKTLSAFYIKDGKIVYQIDENVNMDLYSNDVLKIEYKDVNGSDKYKYYNLKTKELSSSSGVKDVQSDLDEILKDVEIFECSGKYGIMKNDKIVVPCDYKKIKFLPLKLNTYMMGQGKFLALVTKDDGVVLMDYVKNKNVFTFDTDSTVSTSDDSSFIIAKNKNGGTVVYNVITKKSITLEGTPTVKGYSNYITVSSGSKMTYYNAYLDKVYTNE